MRALRSHRLIKLLLGLNLPTDDYVIFGSGPMLAYGLRTDIGDLDIVARGHAWAIATAIQPAQPSPSGRGNMTRLHGGALEIVDQWIDPTLDTNGLIARAVTIDGLPFASLADVVTSKTFTDRPKDHTDLALLHALNGFDYCRPIDNGDPTATAPDGVQLIAVTGRGQRHTI